MNKVIINACPLCDGMRIKPTLVCKDFYASGESFEIACCEDCGFRFTQGFPVEAEIGRYYETPDYISHSDTKRGLINILYHKVRKKMLDRKAGLIIEALGKNTGRLLDIGTGTGYFSDAMKQRNWQVKAIEKNEQARLFAREHFGLDVADEKALDSYPAGSFDVITLWHVMEHLEKLNKTWERLYQLLDTNGILVIAVPNCLSSDAEKYKEMWAAYDVPRHLWHFTPATMKRLGEKHRFTLTKLRPMPFDAFYVSVLSEKYKKASFPFLKGMVSGTAAWFSSMGNPERSSSVIYVFKKSK